MSLQSAINYVQHVVTHKTLFTHKTSDPEFDRPAKMIADMLKSVKAILTEIKNVQSNTEKFISSFSKLSKCVSDFFNDKDSDLTVSDAKDYRSRQETIDSDCRRRLSARLSEEIVDVLTRKIEMLEKIQKNCEQRTKLKGELDHYSSKVDSLRNNPKEDPIRIMRNDQKLTEARRQIAIWDEVVKEQLKHYEKVHTDFLTGELNVMKSIEKEFFEGCSKILSDYESSADAPEYFDPPKHDQTPNISMTMTGMPGMMPGQMGMGGMPGMMPGQMGMGGMPGMMQGQMGMTGMPGMMPGQMGMTGMPGMMPGQMGMGGMPGQMGMGGMQGQMQNQMGMGGMPGQMGMSGMTGMPGQMGMTPQMPGMTMPPAPQAGQVQAQCLYDFAGSSPEELSINVGELVTVIKEDPSGWWTGSCNGKSGIFPGNYVQKL